MTTPRPSEPVLLSSLIAAGFPSPGDELEGSPIDTNQLIVRNPSATFFMRVKGVSMKDIGIFENDIVVIDKSLEPRHGDVVVADIDGSYTLKTLNLKGGGPSLMPANDEFNEITPQGNQELTVWGVVTFVLRSMRTTK